MIRANPRFRFVTLALVTGALLLATLGGSTPTAQARESCHTAAQNITQRKNISCNRAKKVANKARRAFGFSFPECPDQSSQYWNGWKVNGLNRGYIATRLSKGNRKFTLSGGGTC